MSDLFGTPLPTKPYLEQLPATLQAALRRSSRDGRSTRPLPGDLREAIAREALTCGIATSGPALNFFVLRLRAAYGVGRYPTPPRSLGGHTKFVDARIDQALARLTAAGWRPR